MADDTEDKDVAKEEDNEKIQLSGAQIAASSLAAVSAAVICSFFGVAGTIIGTAIASVLATIGSALYSYSLRRTKARLRRLHQAGAASPPLTEVINTARVQGRRLWAQLPLRLLGVGVVIVFVVSMGVVTIIEITAGKPLSDVVRDSHNHSGLSLFDHKTKKSPEPTSSPSPPTSTSPKPTPTKSASTTPTPTVSPTQTTPPTISPTGVLSSLLPTKSPSKARSSKGHSRS